MRAETATRAVIFDMDGVLIDTEPVWRRIEVETFNRLGLTLTYDDTAATMGMRIDEVVRLRHDEHPWPSPSLDEVAGTIIGRVVAHVRRHGEPMPGLDAAIAAATDLGLRVGLASSSSHDLIDAVIERLGLRPHLHAISSADDVGASKPEPDVYLANAALLGVEPAACVAIEDSRNGVLSALAAEMTCVAIPDTHWNTDPDVARAHHRLGSLAELPQLLRTLTTR